MNPDYEKLFILKDPGATQRLRLSIAADPRFWEPDFDELVGDLFKGKSDALPPLQLQYHQGGKPGDVIWTDFVPLMLISQRVLEVIAAQALTGVSTYSVEARDKQRHLLSEYYGCAILGKAGTQDVSRSQVITKPPPNPRGRAYEVFKGIYFTDDYWDGSDFCIMRDTYFKIVTDRVRDAFAQAKIRNVRFVPLREYEAHMSLFRR